jgi:hypothetical protein
MHLEEYLARSAACEVPALFTELDGLLHFLFITVREAFGAGQSECYFRMRCGKRWFSVQTMLVCQQTQVLFGESGEVREVRFSIFEQTHSS